MVNDASCQATGPDGIFAACMNQKISIVERLGNLLAFGLVLFILGIGAHLILSILRSEPTLFSPPPIPVGDVEQDVVALQPVAPYSPASRATPTALTIRESIEPLAALAAAGAASDEPPALPPLTSTTEPTETPTPTATPSPTAEPTATPTPSPMPTPTATATPEPSPTLEIIYWTATPEPVPVPPTPVPPTAEARPAPTFPFQVTAAGTDFGRGCDDHYIFGFVRSQAGNPLPGLQIRALNEFGYEVTPAVTGENPPGWYQLPIWPGQAKWYVQVVDAANNPLSMPFEVRNTGNFINGQEGCWHRVDFGRTE
jgi:outer membrane biosynthesis protein TonB